jgi:hypothetical protein
VPEVERNRLWRSARHGLIGAMRKLLRNSQRDVWPISGWHAAGGWCRRLADVADPDPGRLNWAGCGRRPKVRFGMETGLRRTGTVASIHAVATDGRRAAIMPSRISKYQIPVDVPHILC